MGAVEAVLGSDSMVSVWDPFNRKRLCQFRKYVAFNLSQLIVCLSF